MNRARIAVVATLVGVSLAGPSLVAQKAPEMKPILAGRKVEPPFKGQADVDYVQPVTKRNGDVVTTTIKVKNGSPAPLARLSVTETWFDKGGAVVAASSGALEKPLEPAAVETITIQTPWSAKMNGNGYNFIHANGTVKPHKVAKLDEPKAAAKKK